MNWRELKDLVYNVDSFYDIDTVHYGCECGCGGDSYTEEAWDNICTDGEDVIKKLKKIGITFDD